jgi:serine protease Do
MRVADEPTGKKMPITVLRDGRKLATSIMLTDMDVNVIAQNDRGGNEPQNTQSQALGGMTVRDLTSDERQDLKIDGGVMVTDVREGSAADDAGVSPNDVIEEVGGKPVMSAAALTKVLKDTKTAKKQHAVLLLRSGDQTRFVAMRLD